MPHPSPHALCALLLPLALGSVSSCQAVGPDYEPPNLELPDSWRQAALAGLEEGEAGLETWWQVFDDEVLDALMERARAGNLSLEVAAARIRETRALRRVVAADQVPSVDATGSATRLRQSAARFPVDTGALPLNLTNTVYTVGLEASWELDVWGRVRRNVEAAQAEAQAADEDYRDVLVLLYAEVALAYMDLRTLQQRIDYAEQNVDAQEETLELVGHRYEAELVPELDVRQAELNSYRTKSALPSLRAAAFEVVHRLAVLLGEPPAALYDLLEGEGGVPEPTAPSLASLPTDLLRQRPDVRAAERALAAQTARIGVATAELYPQFSLSGSFGWQSRDAGDLFESGAQTWGFGIPFRWNLFDRDRVHANIEAQEARAEALQASYELTVLNALAEVESALAAYGEQRERTAMLTGGVEAALKSVELVRTLYKSGLTDFQNVLDSERSLFQEQDRLAESRGLEASSLVALYRALGGGWVPGDPLAAPESESDVQDP